MAPKKSVIFDLDGTLIDTSRRHWEVYVDVAQRFDGKPLSKDDYWKLKRSKASWIEILAKSSVNPDKLKDFLKTFIAQIEIPDNLAKDTLFPGVNKLLNDLHKSYDLYLLSLRRSDTNLKQQLENLGIIKYFKLVLSGHTDSEGYEKKVELIRQIPDYKQAIVVGDTEADIQAAKQLGLKSVAILSGIRDEAILRSLEADVLVRSVTDLQATLSQKMSN